VILQSPEIRSVVQQNLLERAFHDALHPRLLFRGEVQPQAWPAGIGDTMVFSKPGLIDIDMTPATPGTDPLPKSYPIEQWTAQLQQYHGTIDTHMPSSMQAIADLFLRNAHQLGLQAARGMNSIVRDTMYNAAESGWTVADGTQGSSTTIRVKRLNGFTRARSDSGSKVRFDLVSSTNPLAVSVNGTSRNVVGFTPDNPGDEIGPGTVTLSVAIGVTDRDYIISSDRSAIDFVGGGNSVDAVGNTDIATLKDVRAAVSSMQQNNVPEHPDGRFHCHMDPTSQSQLFEDDEFQRLNTALPDFYMYRQFVLGELLGTVFFRNSECPRSDNVVGGSTASFDLRDPFAPELFANGLVTGTPLHRMIFTAQGGIQEYFSDMSNLLTDAGMVGKVADPRIVNNGIEVFSDRIQLIIRAPLNRMQDLVSVSWRFVGSWSTPTDAATGGAARYKRFYSVVSGS
jgi:hypothetical protein